MIFFLTPEDEPLGGLDYSRYALFVSADSEEEAVRYAMEYVEPRLECEEIVEWTVIPVEEDHEGVLLEVKHSSPIIKYVEDMIADKYSRQEKKDNDNEGKKKDGNTED